MARCGILYYVCTKPNRYAFVPDQRPYCQYNKSANLELDVLDNFTSHLVERKLALWDMKKIKKSAPVKQLFNKKSVTVNVNSLGSKEITALFQNALEADDSCYIIDLLNACIQQKKCPSLDILNSVLLNCSQKGNVDLIIEIQTLYEKYQPEVLKVNSDFKHFIAEAIWIKGDISKALIIFEDIYRDNAFLRNKIRLMLKFLINDSVSNRSEAALRNIITFSEKLLATHQDFFPISCVWQACFLSEWYTDQCIALELLETNHDLCKAVLSRISFVVYVSLQCHRTEAVYRLLEILLKYNMKTQYSNVLVALLDYQFRTRDLQSCSEIFTWAFQNNVQLPKNQHIKFLNLLLKVKFETPLAHLKPTTKTCKQNFKF